MPRSAQGEPEIEPDGAIDEFRRKPVAAVTDSLHAVGYRTAKATANAEVRDNAPEEASMAELDTPRVLTLLNRILERYPV